MNDLKRVRRMPPGGTARFLPVTISILFFALTLSAQDRFPRPEFQAGYTQPQTIFPQARPALFAVIDVSVLIIAMGCAAYFSLRRRSRGGLFAVMASSVAYFGFYRRGCVCPVGALQNIAAAITDHSFILPAAVVLFFVLPLLFALLFGRVFCSAVCPLGGVQDLVVLKAKRLPVWLERALSLVPHLYLGAAILFAATGAGFLICRFDPFVALFRRSGSFPMLVWGAALLGVGTVVARPYCRFLCPYGIFIGWMSQLSKWHATITPDECVDCRLCVDSCPFNAILSPVTPPREPYARSLRRLLITFAAVPVWLVAGAVAGQASHNTLANLHPKVRLAVQLQREEMANLIGTTIETQTFRAGSVPAAVLQAEAGRVRSRFRIGSILLGGYLGAVVAASLLRGSLLRQRSGYSPDRQCCFSCGRCFKSCPKERMRLEKLRSKERKQ